MQFGVFTIGEVTQDPTTGATLITTNDPVRLAEDYALLQKAVLEQLDLLGEILPTLRKEFDAGRPRARRQALTPGYLHRGVDPDRYTAGYLPESTPRRKRAGRPGGMMRGAEALCRT